MPNNSHFNTYNDNFVKVYHPLLSTDDKKHIRILLENFDRSSNISRSDIEKCYQVAGLKGKPIASHKKNESNVLISGIVFGLNLKETEFLKRMAQSSRTMS
nr:hypothetical protein [Alphaproteobacteria bacterium]